MSDTTNLDGLKDTRVHYKLDGTKQDPTTETTIQDPIFTPTEEISDFRTATVNSVTDLPLEIQNVGNINKENLVTVDPSVDLPRAEQGDPFIDKMMGDLDIAIERDKEKITAFQDQMMDQMMDESTPSEAIEVDQSDSDMESNKSNGDKVKKVYHIDETDMDVPEDSNSDSNKDDDADMMRDLNDEFGADNDYDPNVPEEENQEKEAKEILDGLREAAKDKIIPIKFKADLSTFTISNKAIKPTKAFRNDNTDTHLATWVMPAGGKTITMSALSGPEIVDLNTSNSNQNRLNAIKNAYRVLYNHVVDENKPEFDLWLKTIKFHDVDHLYFCAYMASFNGSNYVAYSCPKCKKVFLNDYKFEDMVKYKNDDAKKKIQSIFSKDASTDPNETDIVLKQVSDSYVVGLKAPSIHDAIIQTASLSDQFLKKYARFVDTISYIDQIYYINKETNELEPIDVSTDSEEQGKVIAKKIRTYYEILYKRINSDQYFDFVNFTNKIDEDNSELSYLVPECECPNDKCKEKIPAEDRRADQMLFTRHQLRAFANMSNTSN